MSISLHQPGMRFCASDKSDAISLMNALSTSLSSTNKLVCRPKIRFSPRRAPGPHGHHSLMSSIKLRSAREP